MHLWKKAAQQAVQAEKEIDANSEALKSQADKRMRTMDAARRRLAEMEMLHSGVLGLSGPKEALD